MAGVSFLGEQYESYCCLTGPQLHSQVWDFKSSRRRCCCLHQDQSCVSPLVSDVHSPGKQARPSQSSGLLLPSPGPPFLSLGASPVLTPSPFLQPCLVSSQLLSTASLPQHLLGKLSCPEQNSSYWSLPTAWSLADKWVFHLPDPVVVKFAQSSTSSKLSPALCPTLDLLERLVPRVAKGERGSCPGNPGMEFHGSETYDRPSLFLDAWFCSASIFLL